MYVFKTICVVNHIECYIQKVSRAYISVVNFLKVGSFEKTILESKLCLKFVKRFETVQT